MRINGIKPTLSSPSRELHPVSSVQHVTRQSKPEETEPGKPAGVSEEQEAIAPTQEEAADKGRLLDKALKDINESLNLLNRRMEFRVHESTNRIMVRVVDKETEQVVKEIPPERFLDMAVKLQELVGLLVDQKA